MDPEPQLPRPSGTPALNLKLTICWQPLAPRFGSDLDTYLRQPFRRPPSFHYVKMYIFNLDTPRNVRAFLLFDDTTSLASFRQNVGRQNIEHASSITRESWHSTKELLYSVESACAIALSAMAQFIQEANHVVFTLVRQLQYKRSLL